MRAAFRSLVVLVLLGAVASGCGSSEAEIEAARKEGAAAERAKQAIAKEKARQRALEKRVAELEKAAKNGGTSPTASSSARTSCSPGLQVGPNTTCPFAENVRSEWISVGGGSTTVYAYSPVTNQVYAMYCSAGIVTTCRGGNRAVVYIR